MTSAGAVLHAAAVERQFALKRWVSAVDGLSEGGRDRRDDVLDLDRRHPQLGLVHSSDELVDPNGAVFVDHDLDDVRVGERAADRRAKHADEFLAASTSRFFFYQQHRSRDGRHTNTAGIFTTSSNAAPRIVSIAMASSGSSSRKI